MITTSRYFEVQEAYKAAHPFSDVHTTSQKLKALGIIFSVSSLYKMKKGDARGFGMKAVVRAK